jgi:hypothetical protein
VTIATVTHAITEELSPASKDVISEDDESTALETDTKKRLMKT